MVYCSKCGNELPENAFFCPKCGVKTPKGAEANVSMPYKDMFEDMGRQLEQAFNEASTEMKKAFEKVKEEFKQSTRREPVTCPNCGALNAAGDSYCSKCGKKIS
jgi:uncharacterized membrane protein YvbJ